MMWDKLEPGDLHNPGQVGGYRTGDRVARIGRVEFVRSGFARVHWDDGGTSDEWAAGLVPATDHGLEEAA